MHFLKKGQKIWVDPPPIRAMPKRKRFFCIDVFHYQDNRLLDAAPAPDVLALREDRDDVEEPRHRLEPEHSSL